jgi:putative PIN family toxin of toxin-antitoxin system
MRALLDTNVLISYLLSRQPTTSATGLIIRAALVGRFTLLFTAGIADELDEKLATRPDLAARIPRADADELLLTLGTVAEVIPRLGEPYPEVGRDRKDDYVIAHAVAANADYLVSWDKDLRDLVQVDGVKVVSPPEFLALLRESGRL